MSLLCASFFLPKHIPYYLGPFLTIRQKFWSSLPVILLYALQVEIILRGGKHFWIFFTTTKIKSLWIRRKFCRGCWRSRSLSQDIFVFRDWWECWHEKSSSVQFSCFPWLGQLMTYLPNKIVWTTVVKETLSFMFIRSPVFRTGPKRASFELKKLKLIVLYPICSPSLVTQ